MAAGHPQAIVGIDEFSALGSDHVMQLIARGREPGVVVVLATQELADLDRAAPGLRDQVLGTAAVKIAHRQDVPASADDVRRRWSARSGSGRRPGGSAGRHSRATTQAAGRAGEVERFALHPNVIKGLRTGEAVVITKQPAARARTVRVGPPRREGPELG